MQKEFAMKNLYRIGIFLMVSVATALLMIYFMDQFIVDVKDIGRLPQVYDTEEQARSAQNGETETQEDMSGQQEAARAAEIRRNVADIATSYIVEEYDRYTREKQVTTQRLPEQYVGMSRKELEDALRQYLEAPSFADLERGLQDVRLISFSPEQITVRKSYYLKPKEPELDYYYLIEEQGYVVVYYQNMDNLFCETGIELETLPKRLQLEIAETKTIETEEELYAFLESYSS